MMAGHEHMSYSLNSLKGLHLYRGLCRGLLLGVLGGILGVEPMAHMSLQSWTPNYI